MSYATTLVRSGGRRNRIGRFREKLLVIGKRLFGNLLYNIVKSGAKDKVCLRLVQCEAWRAVHLKDDQATVGRSLVELFYVVVNGGAKLRPDGRLIVHPECLQAFVIELEFAVPAHGKHSVVGALGKIRAEEAGVPHVDRVSTGGCQTRFKDIGRPAVCCSEIDLNGFDLEGVWILPTQFQFD